MRQLEIEEFFSSIEANDLVKTAKYIDQNPQIIQQQNSAGMNPLIAACFYGAIAIVKFFIDNKFYSIFDTSKVEGNVISPLLAAITRNHLEIIKYLLEKGAKLEPSYLDNPVLHWIIQSRSDEAACLETMLFFINKNLVKIDETDTDQRTALHLACNYNEVRVVEFLIEKGANVNCQDANKNTPLHYASNNQKITEILLKNKANIEISNSENMLPCQRSFQRKAKNIAQLTATEEFSNSLLWRQKLKASFITNPIETLINIIMIPLHHKLF